MLQKMTTEQIAALDAPAPTATAHIMTRTEKLERWATVLENVHHYIGLGDRLERLDTPTLDGLRWLNSPMAHAARDSALAAAGLEGDTVGDAKRFFELSSEDIHALSCNCGGQTTGPEMARRVRGFIRPPAPVHDSATWTG